MMRAKGTSELPEALLYRQFRRRVLLATAVLFGIGLVAALLLRGAGSLWVVATWTAICSPVVVAFAVCLLIPIDRMAVRLGLSRSGVPVRLRPTVLFWMLSAIVLPWIAAWLMADVAGHWFANGGAGTSQTGTGFLLWAVRLLAGVAAYSVASALGVFLTYAFHRSLGEGESGS